MDIFCMYVFYNYVRFSVWYVLYGTPVRVWSFFNICMIVWTFDFSLTRSLYISIFSINYVINISLCFDFRIPSA